MKKVFVSDITLCEAAENRKSLTFREKLNIVAAMQKSGINAIELPAIGENVESGVVYRTITESAQGIKICVNAGASAEQIKASFDCVRGAENLCLQVALPVSTVQMEYMHHLKSNKMLDKIAELICAAKECCSDVEFVALDATRAAEGFAEQCCKVAAENGATAVTLCDNAGIYFPAEFAELVAAVKKVTTAKVYIQPSNALQMAAACAVAAISAGADGVKTSTGSKTYLSAGDFANIVRAKGEAMNIETDLDITAINNIVKNVSEVSRADSIAAATETDAFSSNSTLADITAEIEALGYELSAEDNGKVYEEFKRVVAKKQAIGVRELEAIIASTAMQVPSTYHLINYVVNSGNIINATANITLEKNGEQLSGVSIGDGPIDAAFHAIEQIIGHHYELDDFQIQAVTKGREAVGSSIIRLRAGGKLYSGNGVSTDIIGACVRAYINALNKIVYEGK